jgi:hypothetical protein
MDPNEVDRIEVRRDIGGPVPRYKKVILILMSDGSVRWEKHPETIAMEALDAALLGRP